MIAIYAKVYVDKKDVPDATFLVRQVEEAIRKHCEEYGQTYVADFEVRGILPIEKKKKENPVEVEEEEEEKVWKPKKEDKVDEYDRLEGQEH